VLHPQAKDILPHQSKNGKPFFSFYWEVINGSNVSGMGKWQAFLFDFSERKTTEKTAADTVRSVCRGRGLLKKCGFKQVGAAFKVALSLPGGV